MNLELDVVNRYYDTLNRRDWAAYEALFAPDCVISAPGSFEGTGVEAVRAFDRVWADAATDFRVETKRQFAAGGQVASENVAHATHTGVLRTPSGEIPPTGRTLAGPYVGIFTVRAGKIASQTIYFDQVGLMTQLGVLQTG